MKPKPFSSLNHFTVPVAILLPSGVLCTAKRGGCLNATTAVTRGTAFGRTKSDPYRESSDRGGRATSGLRSRTSEARRVEHFCATTRPIIEAHQGLVPDAR